MASTSMIPGGTVKVSDQKQVTVVGDVLMMTTGVSLTSQCELLARIYTSLAK